MTALVSGTRAGRPSGPTAPGRWLRRLGGVAVTLALMALGLGAGLWLGSPAGAATPSMKVKMAGEAVFSSSSPTPLLSIAALAPGGSVTGTMQVLDNSDSAVGSGSTDTISLLMTSPTATDGPTGKPIPGSGAALRDALAFTLTVTDVGSHAVLRHSAESVVSLASGAGVALASNLANGDTIEVSLTAALPDRAPGADNLLQNGRFAFDLELVLDTSTPGGNGGSGGTGGAGGAGTPAGGASARNQAQGAGDGGVPPEVLGTSKVAPPAAGGANGQGQQSGGKKAPGSVLVLGEHQGLPNTGVPVAALLATGCGVLLAGLALLFAARGSRGRARG